jgi:Uma2 family endonuclease
LLSESKAAVDRGDKLDEYRSIGAFEEYVLIDSRKRWAATYRRVEGEWLASLPQSTGTLSLVSVGLTIGLDDLYGECGVAANIGSAPQ